MGVAIAFFISRRTIKIMDFETGVLFWPRFIRQGFLRRHTYIRMFASKGYAACVWIRLTADILCISFFSLLCASDKVPVRRRLNFCNLTGIIAVENIWPRQAQVRP